MRNLIELKQKTLEYCEKVKRNGGLTVEYQCPDCNSILVSTIPANDDEVWDSATQCYECGGLHFCIKRNNDIRVISM